MLSSSKKIKGRKQKKKKKNVPENNKPFERQTLCFALVCLLLLCVAMYGNVGGQRRMGRPRTKFDHVLLFFHIHSLPHTRDASGRSTCSYQRVSKPTPCFFLLHINPHFSQAGNTSQLILLHQAAATASRPIITLSSPPPTLYPKILILEHASAAHHFHILCTTPTHSQISPLLHPYTRIQNRHHHALPSFIILRSGGQNGSAGKFPHLSLSLSLSDGRSQK
jgi:hypothetical protein